MLRKVVLTPSIALILITMETEDLLPVKVVYGGKPKAGAYEIQGI
ncbi:hypothetical protein [Echinicola strongylocentroti]|nr:hypothetical protein [Echinicola strongylocentroti]